MSESYPHHLETGLGIDEAAAAEVQRMVARLKQEQVQLAADQRQMKQQRLSVEQVKAELDKRQQELERLLDGLQAERKAFLEQTGSADRTLQHQRDEIKALQVSVTARAADLQKREQDLRIQRQALAGDMDRLAAVQKDLQARQSGLEARQREATASKASLDQLAADLQARSDDLQARAAALQEQLAQRDLATKDLTQTRQTIQQREQQLQQQAAELASVQQRITQKEALLRDRQVSLDAQQEDLRRQAECLEGERTDLCEQADRIAEQKKSLESQQQSLESQRQSLDSKGQAIVQQQNTLNKLQADLAARESALRKGETQLSGLEGKMAEVAKRQQELAALQTSLDHKQQEFVALQASLAEKQRCLEQMDSDLRRRQQSLVAATTAGSTEQGKLLAQSTAQVAGLQKEIAQRDAVAKALTEQVLSVNKRLEGMQAELSVLREQKQKIANERDALRQESASLQEQCQSLQERVNEMAVRQSAQAQAPQPTGGQNPTDPLSMLAAHAARTRRKPRSQQTGVGAGGLRKFLAPAAAAGLAAVLAAGTTLTLSPAKYSLSAAIVLPAGSPLAQRFDLTKAQRELGGRLLEAHLAGSHAADSLAVTANSDKNRLFVELLSTAPSLTSANLKVVLDQYRKDMLGEMTVSAQNQLAVDLARQISDCQTQLKDVAARKADLESRIRAVEPQEKAYTDAASAADKARKDLDELRARSEKVSAELRVLQRTPPASKAEVAPERLEIEAARDSQLVAVRGQVAVRGAELREMLADLVRQVTEKCAAMDSHLTKFATFLDSQAKQIPDQTLQGEISRIAKPTAKLRQIVQDSRSTIEDLNSAIAKSKEVSQASQIVSLHGQSEKALETFINQAADTIKQIDAMLEKIPAGGDDVTRRTVLQQRLCAQFALVQKTCQEMTDTLGSLRPSVNFRLDAALSGVEGLARQLDERQKSLIEQIQQQDARRQKQKYDKQVQDAESELSDYNIQRDRVLAQLTTASDNMLQADTGRAQAMQLRGQLASTQRQASILNESLAAVRKKSDNLQAGASRPASITIEGPTTHEPAINAPSRLLSAILAAITTFAVILAVSVLSLQRRPDTRAARS